ncbi:hypothetical protein N0V86_007933 [Didymella sp. IMI 355093]|nr:hypothetical protein N0V86_007933 [Didymella sp. IMI 355093]
MSSNQQQSPKTNVSLVPDLELAILPNEVHTPAPIQSTKVPDPYLVAFSTPDPWNPKDWPTRTKWAVTDVLSATGFNRIMVSTIMAPALTTIAIELHMSHIESVMALSIYTLAAAFGPLVIGPLSEVYGPIIGGFMAGRTTWRWMFWSTSIFQAVMIAVSFTAFKETYAPVILARRARRWRETTGDPRYYTEYERLSANKSVLSILSNALTRPLRLLLFHPIIIIASVNLAFDYGVLYIILTSFAQLWTDYYHVSVEMSGLHYIAVALGELIGAQVGAPMIDRYYRWKKAQHPDGDLAPEYRLPVIFPGALLAPVGLLIYGWTAEHRLHWIAVDTGVFIAMFVQALFYRFYRG